MSDEGKNWDVRRGREAADGLAITSRSLVFPHGKETYFVNEAGESCRSFARHPKIQKKVNGTWQ